MHDAPENEVIGTFTLHGHDFDPHAGLAELGLDGFVAWRSRALLPVPGRNSVPTALRFEQAWETVSTLDDVVAEMLARLHPHAERIRAFALHHRLEAWLSCFIILHRERVACSLTAASMRQLAALDAGFELEIDDRRDEQEQEQT